MLGENKRDYVSTTYSKMSKDSKKNHILEINASQLKSINVSRNAAIVGINSNIRRNIRRSIRLQNHKIQ